LKRFIKFQSRNGYHIETIEKNSFEYLCLTQINSSNKPLLEKLPFLSSGLYCIKIHAIEVHYLINQKFTNPATFII
jgi:hypothetical protein